MAWTYLLECADGSYYVGSTTELELRIEQHRSGAVPGYTSTRLPVELLWAGEFEKIEEAYWFERKLHRWSRAKKQALARGELDRLPLLSSRSRDGRAARAEAQRAERDELGALRGSLRSHLRDRTTLGRPPRVPEERSEERAKRLEGPPTSRTGFDHDEGPFEAHSARTSGTRIHTEQTLSGL
ncbi:MAG: GIY-YIG nuclease family protein [Marmoricola sp.]|nr:GIY-YIG nuclease family protein [Marmoricola sp.]